jgi:hypothetical protein
MSLRSRKYNFKDEAFTITLEVQGLFIPGESAILTGDPYYSSPEEPAEFNIDHVWLGDSTKGQIDVLEYLSEIEVKEIEAKCLELAAEESNGEPPEKDR